MKGSRTIYVSLYSMLYKMTKTNYRRYLEAMVNVANDEDYPSIQDYKAHYVGDFTSRLHDMDPTEAQHALDEMDS